MKYGNIDNVSYRNMVMLCKKHYVSEMSLVELTRLVVRELEPINPFFDSVDILDRKEYIKAAASVGCTDPLRNKYPTRIRTFKEAKDAMDKEFQRRKDLGLIKYMGD